MGVLWVLVYKMKKIVIIPMIVILVAGLVFAGLSISITNLEVKPPISKENNIKVLYKDKTIQRQITINEPDGKIDDNDLWALGEGSYTNVVNEQGDKLVRELKEVCIFDNRLNKEVCKVYETGYYVFEKKEVSVIK